MKTLSTVAFLAQNLNSGIYNSNIYLVYNSRFLCFTGPSLRFAPISFAPVFDINIYGIF